MDAARIIIIEDDASLREDCRANLEIRNHVIVGEAGSLAAAHSLINRLDTSEVDIAIVDGNLSELTNTGDDGAELAEAIHIKLPGVTVIGWSMAGSVRGADLNAPKHNAWALDAMVTELPPRG